GLGEFLGPETMQFFVRGTCTMIDAAVQRDVDGIVKSHASGSGLTSAGSASADRLSAFRGCIPVAAGYPLQRTAHSPIARGPSPCPPPRPPVRASAAWRRARWPFFLRRMSLGFS